jgi:O-methyltransferase
MGIKTTARKIIKALVPYGILRIRKAVMDRAQDEIKRKDRENGYSFTDDPGMFLINRKRNSCIFEDDYFRLSSLELVANEINEKVIDGSVAEVGVYQGGFAQFINLLFPDRTFYLFDTFEGFNEKDIEIDANCKYSLGNQDWSNTSVDMVLKKMRNANKCIVKKGCFPETVKDIEDKFVFVSVDCDLYAPIYAALEYFYPRLVKGGYIFVHDYNNKIYAGANYAVKKYTNENGVSYFPLSDVAGSAVIMK